MKYPSLVIRRTVLIGSLLLPAVIHAQPTSSTPVKMYVGYGPGGGTDLVARAVGEELSKVWSRPVIVENRPGANGAIASKYVARSQPDGSSLLVMPPTSLIIDSLLRPTIAVDPAKELTLIGGLVTTPLVVVVPSSAPYNSLAELIKAARASDGKLSYGWGNLGMRVAMEELGQKTGIRITPIGYKSAGQSVPAIVTGEVNILMIDIAPIAALVKAGKVRALAVSTPDRSPMLPDVPTFKEAGVDVDITGSIALYAPARLPAAAVKKMQQDVASVLKNTELRSRLSITGMSVFPGTPDEFQSSVEQRKRSIEAVVKVSDFKLE